MTETDPSGEAEVGTHWDSRSQSALASKQSLFLVGPSGSGKSALARRLAQSAGWRVLDTDSAVLKESRYETIGEIFDNEGEASFRRLEWECLNRVADMSPGVVVATGGGLPATHGAMEFMDEVGITVYPKASVETLWKRLSVNPGELAQRPLLREGGETQLRELVEARLKYYSQASLIFDTDSLDLGDVLRVLMGVVNLMGKER